MAKIAAMDRTRQVTKAPDRRTLTFAERGDLAGIPVFAMYGMPGCRLNRHPDAALVRSTGAWMINYDRPGYGGPQAALETATGTRRHLRQFRKLTTPGLSLRRPQRIRGK